MNLKTRYDNSQNQTLIEYLTQNSKHSNIYNLFLRDNIDLFDNLMKL